MSTEYRKSCDLLVIDEVEPLTTLITIKNGREVVVRADDDSDAEVTARSAMSVFGAWSDLDWDEAAAALHRIRHVSALTPPAGE